MKTVDNEKKRKGFSLSESLITIAIIGVVFTLSLGTVLADVHRNQVGIRLEKIYSVLFSALMKETANSGSADSWSLPEEYSGASSYVVFKKYLSNNLQVMKDCQISSYDQCDFDFKDITGQSKNLNNTWARFFLNDGMFVGIQYVPTKKSKALYFYVDTNGKKRLNVVGRDIFIFEYWLENELHPEYVGNLYPFGHEFTREQLISNGNANNCNAQMNGNYCGALIMKDGWNIKPGYPWAQARYAVK